MPHQVIPSSSGRPQLPRGIEALHNHYEGRAFAPHWHEEFAIGLIDAGVEKFEYRGVEHCASAGDLMLLDAGEVHTGEAADERGFGFQMLYVAEDIFRELGAASPSSGTLHFHEAVVSNHPAAARLREAHNAYERSGSRLEVETLLLVALREVIDISGNWRTRDRSVVCPTAITRARDYLLAHTTEDVSLEDLTTVSGLSKFHLIRSFKASVGMSPHAYHLQHRVFLAKQLLRNSSATEVAQQCGFFDQSHMNRVFRMLAGTTPGAYARQHRLPNDKGEQG